MIELDFTEISLWEVRSEFLPDVDEIMELEGGVVFVMMAVSSVATHQTPEKLGRRLEVKGVISSPVTKMAEPIAA